MPLVEAQTKSLCGLFNAYGKKRPIPGYGKIWLIRVVWGDETLSSNLSIPTERKPAETQDSAGFLHEKLTSVKEPDTMIMMRSEESSHTLEAWNAVGRSNVITSCGK
jgi:hypothetical protein